MAIAGGEDPFESIVEHALREGPQTITFHGKPAVVVVSFEKTIFLQIGARITSFKQINSFVDGNSLLNFTSFRSRNLGQMDMAALPRFEDFTGSGLRNTEPDSALEGEE